jgi:hypothetical protein
MVGGGAEYGGKPNEKLCFYFYSVKMFFVPMPLCPFCTIRGDVWSVEELNMAENLMKSCVSTFTL